MSTYEFDFNYVEPRWGTAVIDTDDDVPEQDARDEALVWIGQTYPEAMDVAITEVRKLD